LVQIERRAATSAARRPLLSQTLEACVTVKNTSRRQIHMSFMLAGGGNLQKPQFAAALMMA
jgi:hypothetical protein